MRNVESKRIGKEEREGDEMNGNLRRREWNEETEQE
jgi:hypothetical protein